MKRSIIVGILEIVAVIASLVATHLSFGTAATLYVSAAWALIFAYVLTPPRPKRRGTQ